LIIPHNDFEFHKYLYDAYDVIVRPMIEELKTLMFDFSITNEAELFCSTLSFRMNTSIGSKYIGDPSKKEDDAVKAITARLE
jgi:hypothetical protein